MPGGRPVRLDLSSHLNNAGIAPAGRPAGGGLDGMGTAFRGESLPAPGAAIVSRGTPFFLARGDRGSNDNIACEGQEIPLPARAWEALHVLGMCDWRPFEEPLRLMAPGGACLETRLGLSDAPRYQGLQYGESAALSCPLTGSRQPGSPLLPPRDPPAGSGLRDEGDPHRRGDLAPGDPLARTPAPVGPRAARQPLHAHLRPHRGRPRPGLPVNKRIRGIPTCANRRYNCFYVVLDSLLRFHGHEPSGPCFANWDFVYLREGGPFAIHGRAIPLPRLLGAFGIKLFHRGAADGEPAWQAVRTLIDADTPVAVSVDVFPLARAGLYPRLRHADHQYIAAGYDDEAFTVHLVDPSPWQPGARDIPLDLFLACWDMSAISGAPDRFNWTWLEAPSPPPPLRRGPVQALLRRTCGACRPPAAGPASPWAWKESGGSPRMSGPGRGTTSRVCEGACGSAPRTCWRSPCSARGTPASCATPAGSSSGPA